MPALLQLTTNQVDAFIQERLHLLHCKSKYVVLFGQDWILDFDGNGMSLKSSEEMDILDSLDS